MVNHGKVKSQVKHFISIEKKLFVDEAMVHIKNGNYNKAMYLYNKVSFLIVKASLLHIYNHKKIKVLLFNKYIENINKKKIYINIIFKNN